MQFPLLPDWREIAFTRIFYMQRAQYDKGVQMKCEHPTQGHVATSPCNTFFLLNVLKTVRHPYPEMDRNPSVRASEMNFNAFKKQIGVFHFIQFLYSCTDNLPGNRYMPSL